jgi:hypothetical protein
MNALGLCLIVQLFLAVGVAGLFWPDKLMPIFETLMFPFPASYKGLRANSVLALGLSLLRLAKLVIGVS